jgi:hypothetical protein
MSCWRNLMTVTLLLACGSASGFAVTSSHHKKKHSHVVHGQQAIDADRASQIQAALIREHYMDGQPTGVWDDHSKQAMLKYQADNGWQTKVTPDSRALIKLGLGPTEGSGETVPVAAGHTSSTSHPATASSTIAPPTAKPPAHTLGSAINAQSTSQNLVTP